MIEDGELEVHEMLFKVIRSLVDHPENVQIVVSLTERAKVFRIITHPSDKGKVIGRSGRTARALRVILGANAMRLGKNYRLDIAEELSSGD